MVPAHVWTRVLLIGAISLWGAVPGAARAQADFEVEITDELGRPWPIDGATTSEAAPSERAGGLTIDVVVRVPGAASVTVAVDGSSVATRDFVQEGPSVVTAALQDGTDDVEELLDGSAGDLERWPPGYTYDSSSDLEFGYDPAHGPQLAAVRFRNVEVPADARIQRAEVTFIADGDSEGPLTVTVVGARPPHAWAQDADGTGSGGLTSLGRTDASEPWVLTDPWQAGAAVTTPDLAAIVNELLAGRDPGGAFDVVLLFEHASGSGFRRAYAFDGDPTATAELHLTLDDAVATEIRGLEIDAPPPGSDLVVTVHDEPAGGGAVLATRRFEGVAAAAEPTPMPAPEASEPPRTEPEVATEEPPPPAADAPDPAPDAPDAPDPEPIAPVAPDEPEAPVESDAPDEADAPDEPDAPVAPDATVEGADLWFAELHPAGERASSVTVLLTAPAIVDVTPILVRGTCEARGAPLVALTPIEAGTSGSSTRIAVSAPVLTLGGYVVVIDGRSDACVPLGR